MARVTISSNNLFPGPRGAQGPAGPAGGPEGPAGPQGPQGNVGPQGPQGIQGPAGPTGAGGAQGLKGDTGNKGDKGDKGDPGTNGTNGAGVVVGGTAGQALTKINSTDYNTQWTTIPLLDAANSFTAQNIINATGTSTVDLIVRAAAGQTANLIQAEDSTSATIGGISAVGSFFTTGRITVGFSSAQPNFKALISNNTSTTDVVLGVRAIASQSANIFEAQNSAGTALTVIRAGGQLGVGGVIAASQAAIISSDPTFVGLRVRGAASQTANLQEWQDSGGTVLTSVNAVGLIRVNSTNTDAMITSTGNATYDALRLRSAAGLCLWGAGSTNRMFYSNLGGLSMTGGNWSVGRLDIDAGSASTIALVVRGQASQTADLQQWQNSAGTVQASMSAAGSLSANFVQNVAVTGGYLDLQLTTPRFIQRITTAVGLIVRGAASQTANLTQWQDSGATVLASVDASGNMRGTSVRSINDYTSLLEANSGGYVRMTRQTAATPNPGANLGSLYFRDGTNAGTLKLVVRAGAAGAETTILDNIPQ